ncbi:MAG: hypothetical protein ABI700_11920, partial [Chloroflexota bacterium]
MSGFLEDIRQLSERGDIAAALELVDLWLSEHPADREARLLRADLSLSRKQNYAYVGQLLLEYAHDNSAALTSLRQRSNDLAWSLVAEGRERLRGRDQGEALDLFNHAVDLLPGDPVVALAAGLALTRTAIVPEATIPRPLFEANRRKLTPALLSAALEAHLRRVIGATTANQRPYEVAATALIRHWLTQGKVNPTALRLLGSIPAPMPSTVDLLAELHQRIITLMLDTIASLLRLGLPDKADLLFKVCQRADFATARLLIYSAEGATPEAALSAYEQALTLVNEQPVITSDAAQTLLFAAEGMRVTCPSCAKSIRPNEDNCAFCDTSLLQKPILIDLYPDASDA